jgi:hypothetical protein
VVERQFRWNITRTPHVPVPMSLSLLAILALFFVAACQQPVSEFPIRGVVTAGPVCPVVTDPPGPACEDRPVGGAEIVVTDASGAEVARVESGEDGSFSATVPVAGRYSLAPQPVEGLLGTAASVDVFVEDAEHPPVVIVYDTGIR